MAGEEMFRDAVVALFREAFLGIEPGASGTWFVEKSEALLPTMDEIDAATASRSIPGYRTTVGAHFAHACYYLSIFNAFARGEEPAVDWEGSWRQTEFSTEEWTALKNRFRHEFETAEAKLRTFDLPDDKPEYRVSMIANVAHAAFHLGAIRALIPLAQGR